MTAIKNEPPVTGQVVIVTGSGQGIGRSIALRLAQDGMDVVVADLKAAQAEEVAGEIRALGRRALGVAMDVSQESDRQRLVDETLRQMGRLDALVNNAGIMIASRPLEVTEAHWDRMMAINAKSVYFMAQVALRQMVAQKSGRVVNIASIAGKMAHTLYHPVYNVAKASVIAMTKTLAHATAKQGVRVNCVCPGVIETAMQDVVDQEFAQLSERTPDQIRNDRLSRVPMGRVGNPDDVAPVVSFLIGPDSHYMTGQAINVSGGMVMY